MGNANKSVAAPLAALELVNNLSVVCGIGLHIFACVVIWQALGAGFGIVSIFFPVFTEVIAACVAHRAGIDLYYLGVLAWCVLLVSRSGLMYVIVKRAENA